MAKKIDKKRDELDLLISLLNNVCDKSDESDSETEDIQVETNED